LSDPRNVPQKRGGARPFGLLWKWHRLFWIEFREQLPSLKKSACFTGQEQDGYPIWFSSLTSHSLSIANENNHTHCVHSAIATFHCGKSSNL
jgi:hypothetical protein